MFSMRPDSSTLPDHADSDKVCYASPEAHVTEESASAPKRESIRPDCEAPALHPSLLQSKSKKFATAWSMSLLTLASAAVAVWFSQRVMVDRNELPKALQLTPGGVVLVVNILSQLVAFLSLSLFSEVTEHLRWYLACRKEGTSLATFLGLSRTTDMMGVFYLFGAKGSHQIWGVQRCDSPPLHEK